MYNVFKICTCNTCILYVHGFMNVVTHFIQGKYAQTHFSLDNIHTYITIQLYKHIQMIVHMKCVPPKDALTLMNSSSSSSVTWM